MVQSTKSGHAVRFRCSRDLRPTRALEGPPRQPKVSRWRSGRGHERERGGRKTQWLAGLDRRTRHADAIASDPLTNWRTSSVRR